jgi:hypothetical protein
VIILRMRTPPIPIPIPNTLRSSSAVQCIVETNSVEGVDACFVKECSLVGFEVLTAVSTKMAVFWVVAPCSLVEVYQRFRGHCCLRHQGDDDGGSKDF